MQTEGGGGLNPKKEVSFKSASRGTYGQTSMVGENRKQNKHKIEGGEAEWEKVR